MCVFAHERTTHTRHIHITRASRTRDCLTTHYATDDDDEDDERDDDDNDNPPSGQQGRPACSTAQPMVGRGAASVPPALSVTWVGSSNSETIEVTQRDVVTRDKVAGAADVGANLNSPVGQSDRGEAGGAAEQAAQKDGRTPPPRDESERRGARGVRE